MKSEYVITQKDVAGETNPEDSVGMASYGVDEWPCAIYPLDDKVALSGGYFSMLYLDEAHNGIYKIPDRSITPKLRSAIISSVQSCSFGKSYRL